MTEVKSASKLISNQLPSTRQEEAKALYRAKTYHRKEAQILRFIVSDVAAIVGLHKYKSIIDLFEKYLYQDLEELYEMDVECMSNLFDLDICDVSVPVDKDTQINHLISSLPAEAKEAKVALQELQDLRVQGQQAHVAESAQASSAIIQQMKEVMNSTSITNSVATGAITSSSMAMLREELTGEVRKRHGTIAEESVLDVYESVMDCQVGHRNADLYVWPVKYAQLLQLTLSTHPYQLIRFTTLSLHFTIPSGPERTNPLPALAGTNTRYQKFRSQHHHRGYAGIHAGFHAASSFSLSSSSSSSSSSSFAWGMSLRGRGNGSATATTIDLTLSPPDDPPTTHDQDTNNNNENINVDGLDHNHDHDDRIINQQRSQNTESNAETNAEANAGSNTNPSRRFDPDPAMTNLSEPDFYLIGKIDGISDQLDTTSEDPRQWRAIRIVIEVKSRVDRIPIVPPIYDQIQLVAYMLMLGCQHGHLVQAITRGGNKKKPRHHHHHRHYQNSQDILWEEMLGGWEDDEGLWLHFGGGVGGSGVGGTRGTGGVIDLCGDDDEVGQLLLTATTMDTTTTAATANSTDTRSAATVTVTDGGLDVSDVDASHHHRRPTGGDKDSISGDDGDVDHGVDNVGTGVNAEKICGPSPTLGIGAVVSPEKTLALSSSDRNNEDPFKTATTTTTTDTATTMEHTTTTSSSDVDIHSSNDAITGTGDDGNGDETNGSDGILSSTPALASSPTLPSTHAPASASAPATDHHNHNSDNIQQENETFRIHRMTLFDHCDHQQNFLTIILPNLMVFRDAIHLLRLDDSMRYRWLQSTDTEKWEMLRNICPYL